MTEPKDSSAMTGNTPPQVTTQSGPGKWSQTVKYSGIVLGILAITLTLVSGIGLYKYSLSQSQQQMQKTQTLTEHLAELQQQIKTNTQQLEDKIVTQHNLLQQSRHQLAVNTRQLDELKSKVISISGNDAHTWMLAQADYMVKMAGRKLWSDQDVTTAAALLKSADSSLAEMNDPSLIEARRALTEDISTLSTLNQIDYDGIILKLIQLANGTDNLHIADNDSDNSPMDADSNELSSSLHEWRQNLVKSWHQFMDDFITIRRRDNSAEPLLAPNQDVYLRENIRSRLLIAAQAVPRHQDEIYKQSIDTVSTWVRAWFDSTDSTTKAFLDQLEELSQQSVSMDVPETLKSQPLIDRLMQVRVRNLLATPSGEQRAQGE